MADLGERGLQHWLLRDLMVRQTLQCGLSAVFPNRGPAVYRQVAFAKKNLQANYPHSVSSSLLSPRQRQPHPTSRQDGDDIMSTACSSEFGYALFDQGNVDGRDACRPMSRHSVATAFR
ncbi:hypothetical protein H920_08963 [Fukomys damarensis]|uniref:Uncharacterized protein n=1 Tax=Fukomys damarensis TaxID=885580 RepID=A0A091E3K5_FUKDA|nr:hypothetical protein H920_08963 [Fukomys damarensis]